MALSHHSNTRGECPHCETTTPWIVRPLNGVYRCLDCGNNPLNAPRRVSA